jgi:hypothetical protein
MPYDRQEPSVEREVHDVIRTFAAEFSKTSADERRKKSLRLAPEASVTSNRSAYGSGLGGLLAQG